MALSDEEGEIVPDCATNYLLVDSKENLISFSSLPLIWNDNDSGQRGVTLPTESTFLKGAVDEGCGRIYTRVTAWKFILSCAIPEIYVLRDSNYERWIKLQKPNRGYESIARTALITVHCLHFMKKSSKEISVEDLWKHLGKTFSSYEDPPSANDLADHLQLIKEAALRDKDIAKTKNLHAFLSQIPEKRKAYCQDNKTRKKPKFIVHDDEDIYAHNYSSDEDHDDLFDNVCAYCDDGGNVLGCEGRCIRSFHATIESGADSKCESLCYSSEQVQAIDTFLCKNCKHQRHQCYICGRLGNSDRSSGAEVFPCVSATCGHFYHPDCLSELLFPRNDYQAQVFKNKIKAGDSFTCPAHKCNVCKLGEDKKLPEMQFAICRRCPKAYHRKCLPSSILFHRDDANNIPQRAWTGLLNNRILIYCRDHKIWRKILTPRRDHLLFPDDDDGKIGQHSTRSKAFGSLLDEDKVEKNSKGTSGDILSGDPINKNRINQPGIVSKQNLSSSRINVGHPGCRNLEQPSTIKNNQICGKRMSISSMTRIPEKDAAENPPTGTAATLRTAEMKNRIHKLMEDSVSSFNKEEFLADQRRKCSHDSSTYFQVNKTITLGKIELSVQAIRGALQKLHEGGTVKDAMDVCEPAILTQIIKWKKKLAVYLAPFIHGVRYTSFGRHFTNVDKLKQVVNRLRWYVQDGDMIVDFSCGSNDFSCFMKEELDSMGKRCYFKNYDIIQTRNDFNFEKKDWMTVGAEELSEGSKLIIGLNPPFGVQASLANQFINKALTFRPKLLILIVPKETERLDRKNSRYDLIWEDDKILSGKSFYLPGSVDVHDQQIEQWNLDTPPLYLWSRPDWTGRHKQVAVECSHLIENQEMELSGGIRASSVSNYLMEENQDCYGDFSSIAAAYNDINNILEELPEPSDEF
ncbi:protein ENHANCED DOWNY MILDEW 2-like isoform X1 [Salvia hispanica]|uniref:protein ENHANCED DOWNY MILDEW 2-like isoform X1 n=1 Tax=Salvia hispanica TaxID=49212 RepID=UPI0020094346|nr:protein ENHANCED DOWNY MILDEW 2-like isoform X1 [Salvia hispanica]